MPITKTCIHCGKSYICRPSKANERLYCGTTCNYEAHRKYPDVDEKTKRKFYRDTWANNDPDRAKNLYIKTFTTYYNTPNGRAEHMLNNARTRAKRKGIQITITKEWIKEKLEIGKCEITGIPFVLSSNGGKGHKENSFSPSLDRINQTGDYTPENSRVVVWIYNRARGAFPDGDFDILLDALRSGNIHNKT